MNFFQTGLAVHAVQEEIKGCVVDGDDGSITGLLIYQLPTGIIGILGIGVASIQFPGIGGTVRISPGIIGCIDTVAVLPHHPHHKGSMTYR